MAGPASTQSAELSVVFVNYQSYSELRGCLASLRQDAARGAALVVVDHSTDPASADALAADFPGVRILRIAGNYGFAAGVNRGARECDTTYLLLVNPDSVVEPDLCATLAAWMDAHPDVGAVGPRIRNRDGSVQASARRFPNLTTAIAGRSSWLTRAFPRNPLSRWNLPLREAGPDTPARTDWVSGACVMIRRAAFDAVGGMDEGFFLYWEDADFCRRLASAGWQTMYFPGVAAVHMGGGSSRHAADASLVAFHQSAYRLFRKHAGPAAQILAPLVYAGLRVRLAFMRRLVRG